jgi:hypothetical protein
MCLRLILVRSLFIHPNSWRGNSGWRPFRNCSVVTYPRSDKVSVEHSLYAFPFFLNDSADLDWHSVNYLIINTTRVHHWGSPIYGQRSGGRRKNDFDSSVHQQLPRSSLHLKSCTSIMTTLNKPINKQHRTRFKSIAKKSHACKSNWIWRTSWCSLQWYQPTAEDATVPR